MVVLFVCRIDQSFRDYAYFANLFAGLINHLEIMYTFPICMQGWNCISFILKKVMCISLFSLSITSKMNTYPIPLEMSCFEMILTYIIHECMYTFKGLIGIMFGFILFVCIDGMEDSSTFVCWCGLSKMYSFRVNTCISINITNLEK
jgi:hypothetical protein